MLAAIVEEIFLLEAESSFSIEGMSWLTHLQGPGIGIDLDLKEDMTLTNSASISADTEGIGHGGIISVKTPSLNMDSGSITTGTFWEGGAGSIGGDAGSIILDVGTLTLTFWGVISTMSLAQEMLVI